MEEIKKIFSNKKGQKKIAEFLLKNGLKVTEDREIKFKDIEIAEVRVARILDVDRRVVKSTLSTIVKNPGLYEIFSKLDTVPILSEVAPALGYGAIEIIPSNAASKGIVAGVTKIITDQDIAIRQLIAEDPMFENAELTIVTEKPIPRELIDKILKLEGVSKVVVLN